MPVEEILKPEQMEMLVNEGYDILKISLKQFGIPLIFLPTQKKNIHHVLTTALQPGTSYYKTTYTPVQASELMSYVHNMILESYLLSIILKFRNSAKFKDMLKDGEKFDV